MKSRLFHPFVLMIYFSFMLVIIMFSGSFSISIVAFIGAFFYLLIKTKFREFRNVFGVSMTIILFSTLLNPLFSHRGSTQLFFVNDIPITLESMFYGLNLGLSICNCILWLKMFGIECPRENVLNLLGKFAPKTSLALSMSMHYVPMIKRKFRKIENCQKSTGVLSAESNADKIKFQISVFSKVFDWSIEKSVDTSLSMKARGYGVCRRTFTKKSRFSALDFVSVFALVIIFSILLISLSQSQFSTAFYPKITVSKPKTFYMILLLVMAFLPLIIEIKERIKWKFYLSKI